MPGKQYDVFLEWLGQTMKIAFDNQKIFQLASLVMQNQDIKERGRNILFEIVDDLDDGTSLYHTYTANMLREIMGERK